MAESVSPGDVLAERIPQSIDDLLDGFEKPFYWIGLNTPWKRFMGLSSLAAGALLLWKPNALFKKDGTARQFGSDSESTYIPWYVFPIGVGLWAACFV